MKLAQSRQLGRPVVPSRNQSYYLSLCRIISKTSRIASIALLVCSHERPMVVVTTMVVRRAMIVNCERILIKNYRVTLNPFDKITLTLLLKRFTIL
jgi:hypothetical protein